METNNTYRSDEIDKFINAFSKAQGAYKTLVPDTKSTRGNFASLRAILCAVREALSSNGLAFWQHIELMDEGSQLLISMLAHESGQFIQSKTRLIIGKTDRRTGNIIEIHKRLHALLLLGIAPSENDPIAFDDNGEEISQESFMEKVRKPQATQMIVDKNDTINKQQHDELLVELDGYPEIAEEIMDAYLIETMADLPREAYHKTKRRILEIKKNLEEFNKRNR